MTFSLLDGKLPHTICRCKMEILICQTNQISPWFRMRGSYVIGPQYGIDEICPAYQARPNEDRLKSVRGNARSIRNGHVGVVIALVMVGLLCIGS